MNITQEQHASQALRLLWGAAEHLHMLEGGEPYRAMAMALAEAVEVIQPKEHDPLRPVWNGPSGSLAEHLKSCDCAPPSAQEGE